MTMAGLTIASRQCHLTNPPPTCYKPPRIISLSSSHNLAINKTENKVTRLIGQNHTTTYVAAINPPSTPDKN